MVMLAGHPLTSVCTHTNLLVTTEHTQLTDHSWLSLDSLRLKILSEAYPRRVTVPHASRLEQEQLAATTRVG